jgi:hypothetical protein
MPSSEGVSTTTSMSVYSIPSASIKSGTRETTEGVCYAKYSSIKVKVLLQFEPVIDRRVAWFPACAAVQPWQASAQSLDWT